MAPRKFTVPFYPIASTRELARARRDPKFRRKLLSTNLNCLSGALQALREGPEADNPDLVPLIREACELVKTMAAVIETLPMPDPED